MGRRGTLREFSAEELKKVGGGTPFLQRRQIKRIQRFFRKLIRRENVKREIRTSALYDRMAQKAQKYTPSPLMLTTCSSLRKQEISNRDAQYRRLKTMARGDLVFWGGGHCAAGLEDARAALRQWKAALVLQRSWKAHAGRRKVSSRRRAVLRYHLRPEMITFIKDSSVLSCMQSSRSCAGSIRVGSAAEESQ